MEFILDIVKENGIIDIIYEYKDNMERYELENKITEVCQEINKMNSLLSLKNQMVEQTIADENKNKNHNYHDYSIRNKYKQLFISKITDKLHILREKHIDLQIKKYLKYGEETIVNIGANQGVVAQVTSITQVLLELEAENYSEYNYGVSEDPYVSHYSDY